MIWVSVWDTPLEAARFTSTLADWLKARYDVTSEDPDGATERRWRVPAADGRAARAVLVRVTEQGGRPVVHFVDAPRGVAGALADGARATLDG